MMSDFPSKSLFTGKKLGRYQISHRENSVLPIGNHSDRSFRITRNPTMFFEHKNGYFWHYCQSKIGNVEKQMFSEQKMWLPKISLIST
jgi:hypothetical protein